MTLTVSALVLAWVAIAVLTLAMAGMLRQLSELNRAVSADGRAGSIIGLAVPANRLPVAEERARRPSLVLFVSTQCQVCQAAVERLHEAAPPGANLVLATTSQDFGSLMLPDDAIEVPSAAALAGLVGVSATPYLLVLDGNRIVRFANVVTPETDLASATSLVAREAAA